MNEATARIKINRLLEAVGWRFFDEGGTPANIRLEPSVAIAAADLDGMGDDFEKAGKGFVDFLLLDDRGFPLVVLEAKSEDKDPLVGKEQARRYARSLNCRFVIMSNGNLHYFWDLDLGKLRRAADVDRRLTLREILEKALGLIPRFKSKDELLDEEFDKFLADQKLEDPESILAVKPYFKAYLTNGGTRDIIDERRFPELATNAAFSLNDYRAVPQAFRALVPDYIKDYVSLNQFSI